jgi:nucleoside-diphosphate-sugar epimerase
VAAALAGPAALVSRLTGRQPPVTADTVRMLAHGSIMDGAKAVRELGIRYTPFEAGLRRTLAWYWEAGLLRRKPKFLD